LAKITANRPTVVAALGTTQTLAWASSYYLPAILADGIATGAGISRSWVFGVVVTTSPSPMVVDAFGGVEGLNRPGARYLAAGHRTVDHAVMTTLEAMREEAYRAYYEEAQNAWCGNNNCTR
jgi:hypothetical protein